MFGKKNSDNHKNESSSVRSTQGGVTGHNIIVATTKLTGNVKAENDFRIDGDFEGELKCEAKVIIGEGGRFQGDIECVNAVVEGHFKGQLNVSEVLYVKESAVIHGEVITGKLVVQSGSIFEVKCKMTGQNSPGIKIDENLVSGKKKDKVLTDPS